MHSPGPTARLRLLAVVAVTALVAGVFAQTLGFGFVNYDDDLYVTANAVVREGLTLKGLQWAFSTFHAANWHPVTWLSHLLDASLYGGWAGGHHLTSVLFHAANTLLLILALNALTGSFWRSLFVGALFGLHPLHVESVAWVSERKDVLSAFWLLLTLLAYAGYARKERAWALVLALACFALGLASKPMLVTLPFLLLLLDGWPFGRLWTASGGFERRVLREKAPFFALAFASCCVTWIAQQRGGAVASLGGVPFSFRLLNAVESYVWYAARTLWPADLAVGYPLPERLNLLWGLGAAALLCAASWLVYACRRRAPYAWVGWLWYLGSLVPVIGLVQVGEQARADRYTYLPLIGLFLILAWGAADLAERFRRARHAIAGIGTAAVLALAVLSARQASYWRDGVHLFERATRVLPASAVAHRLLGDALGDAGRIGEAEQRYRRALELRPDDAMGQNNLGLLLCREGRMAEGVVHLRTAAGLAPERVQMRMNLAGAYVSVGDANAASREYAEAARLDPADPGARYGLGLALGMAGRLDESIRALEAALSLKPAFPEAHCNLAVAYANQGNLEKAVEHFQAALRMQPDLAEARKGLEAALRLRAARSGSLGR